MKAAVQTTYGGPEVVSIQEVTTPTAGEGEVLVKVRVTTVNRTDCGFRAASPFIVRAFSGLTKPKVQTLGSEFAGDVAAVGAGVTAFAVGDRVFGFSEDRFGAHAEYLVMPADGALAVIPEHVTYESAAASTEAVHYARTTILHAKVAAGHRVLVYGASGAIGSAAVQLLKHMGATVTAVCATQHLDVVNTLGADRVIDYTVQDFTKDDTTYDVVIDAVGKTTFGACKPLLKPKGIYASSDLGPYAQNPLLGLVTPLLGGKRASMPLPPRRDHATIEHFGELLAAGDFVPVIDRRYPLAHIVDAYAYVDTGQKVGNVLILVDPDGDSSGVE